MNNKIYVMPDKVLELIWEKVEYYKALEILSYDQVVFNNRGVNNEIYTSKKFQDLECFQNPKTGEYSITILSNALMELYFFANQLTEEPDNGYYLEIEYRYNTNWARMATHIYESEEEYFMQSTVENLQLSIDRNFKVASFMAQLKELIRLRAIEHGKSTS
ncbi:hypothetical protein BZF66_05405 [Salmonella enterica]|nr:hypothetical protein CPT_Munch_455 [Salmonella phage Munch]EAZ2022728.1 hypothetical protein [Salmonella enterica]ECV9083862.1 hypothetical protein [Salmonella enterica subsp. enterica serovar Infantis]MCP0435542.1 hypothetical protein [Salmonella enterica subsp. enterica serovar Mbandaka]EHX8550675.1 hypothetical protein [Salmonella enterica]